MSKKQKYIGRASYSNDLPAPLIAPKLLKYDISEEQEAGSSQLISSLYTKTNVNNLVNLDSDLGMSVDLFKIPGFLNNMDQKFLNGYDNIKLDAKDKILLRDPRIDRMVKTDLSKVSFLRRTEYVSTSIAQHTDASLPNGSNTNKRARESDDGDKMLSSSEILERVESTFEKNNADLESLKHPVKKNLKAVKSWNVLPDTSSMDQNFFVLKFVGSAKLTASEKAKYNTALQSAVFRPVELEEDDWISMYVTDPKTTDAQKLVNEMEIKLDDETINDDKTQYKFKRFKDFDMKQIQTMDIGTTTSNKTNNLDNLVMIFNDERQTAYFKPIRSRIELRKRRVNDFIKPIVREHNLDQINITWRNQTPEETSLRDKLRTKFDPIDFPYVEPSSQDTE